MNGRPKKSEWTRDGGMPFVDKQWDGVSTHLEPEDFHLHQLHLKRLLLLSLRSLGLAGVLVCIERAVDGSRHGHVEVTKGGDVRGSGLGHHLRWLADAARAETSKERRAVVGRHSRVIRVREWMYASAWKGLRRFVKRRERGR